MATIDPPNEPSKPVLDPINRLSEVLFGLIMVLTFTGSLSVAEAGHAEIRTMLVGALGCNLAWGVIDAVFYLISNVAERSRAMRAFRTVRASADPGEGQRMIAEALPPVVASLLRPAELESLRQRLLALPEPPDRLRPTLDDWKGALAVLLLVFLSTFPVVIPFTFMHDASAALRLSNAIAIAMLFGVGFAFGRITGRHPWSRGLAMIALGGILVAITMALGG